MKKYFYFLIILSYLTSCSSDPYTREPLPENFKYKILLDESNLKLEKNQVTIEIQNKLTEGQIATLADKVFNTKEKQRRFYIYYLLPNMKQGKGAWATSHFDPNLEIKIIGSTIKETEKQSEINFNDIKGELIGKWKEEQYTSSIYVLSKLNNKYYLKTFYKNGQTSEEMLNRVKEKNIVKYKYPKGTFNDEYFIINSNNNLEFYNKENKNFTTGQSLN